MAVSRRQLLRGASLGAGAMVFSPLVRQLEAQAAGTGNPVRFVFVVEGNGLPFDQIYPKI